jgi:pyruvate kinase
MIVSPVPTRAEVSDVGTAVFEGADAVMLSAESAAGQFPVQAVATMNRIAEEIEADQNYAVIIAGQRGEPEHTGADAIAAAARQIAETIDLKAIVAWTLSGSTALRIARERPLTPILVLTAKAQTARRLTLVWGVHPVIGEDIRDVTEMAERGAEAALREGFAIPGQRVILVAGVPFGTPGATNMIRIAFVNADAKG